MSGAYDDSMNDVSSESFWEVRLSQSFPQIQNPFSVKFLLSLHTLTTPLQDKLKAKNKKSY